MPTKRKRVPVLFDDKSVVALGLDPDIEGEVSGAALAGTLTRYADLMYVAAAELDRIWRRAQWMFVMDCLKSCKFPAHDPATHLAAHLAVVDAIEEAHLTRRVGETHFVGPAEQAKLTVLAAKRKADAIVAGICQELRDLTPVHGAAVLAAAHWYWAHEDELKDSDMEWWLPHARNKSFNSRPPDRPQAKPKTCPKNGAQKPLFE